MLLLTAYQIPGDESNIIASGEKNNENQPVRENYLKLHGKKYLIPFEVRFAIDLMGVCQ
jgi:hypothetical protein